MLRSQNNEIEGRFWTGPGECSRSCSGSLRHAAPEYFLFLRPYQAKCKVHLIEVKGSAGSHARERILKCSFMNISRKEDPMESKFSVKPFAPLNFCSTSVSADRVKSRRYCRTALCVHFKKHGREILFFQRCADSPGTSFYVCFKSPYMVEKAELCFRQER